MKKFVGGFLTNEKKLPISFFPQNAATISIQKIASFDMDLPIKTALEIIII